MTKVTLIGTGNVSFHLCKAFCERKIEVSLYGRNKTELEEFRNQFKIKLVDKIEQIDEKSLVILCVNDDKICSILSNLNLEISVAYTSGSVTLNSLPERENLGVFYPLQTFSKARKVDIFKTPFLIEATNEYFSQILFDLAWIISSKVEFADSEKRKHLHLAAVFANNFTNHLFYLSKDYLSKNNIDFNLLTPLIKETFSKLEDLNPFEAQTGPAKRMDFETIDKQKNLLEGNNLEIYEVITKSILETYK